MSRGPGIRAGGSFERGNSRFQPARRQRVFRSLIGARTQTSWIPLFGVSPGLALPASLAVPRLDGRQSLGSSGAPHTADIDLLPTMRRNAGISWSRVPDQHRPFLHRIEITGMPRPLGSLKVRSAVIAPPEQCNRRGDSLRIQDHRPFARDV
jgi:hypothetical protein